ncbi:MAG TPA: hypothetical protein DSN98_00320 [Thermoplasmata archaeon]|jgi:hypothetical protein|nr:MAG TPA: hypothetical protein DSN98_00320 [Thermoplasmata archaeon]
MNTKPLIGISICAVILLVLGSLTNVVGYQTFQSSNQKIINEEINQKELLFQTIVDIANNKDIPEIVLKSQINREGLFNPDVKFSIFNTPALTKNQLNHMYLVGLMLSKIISKTRIHPMVEQYQVNNQRMQKEISVVIEKDVLLKGEMTDLSSLQCDCENNNTTVWHYPVICALLWPLTIFAIWLALAGIYFLIAIISYIETTLNCLW